MAGDWLKFEKATPDKPEVFAIAARLEMDPDAVVGKLIRVWSWFDTHTIDGNGRSVTAPLLDRISGVTGFVAAMAAVGWVVIDNDGVRLPNFERHTGETAKGRALTAKRVANHKGRGNAKGNADSVSAPLPREEKRREEQKEQKKEPVRFAEWWAAYPKKIARKAAEQKWRSADLDPIADRLIADVKQRAECDDGWVRGFVPDPMTYLNQERWNDDLRSAPAARVALAAPSKTLSAIQKLEGMKNGLAGNRNPDGHPEVALLGFGPNPGDRLD